MTKIRGLTLQASEIYDPVFKQTVFFVLGGTPKQVRAWVGRKTGHSEPSPVPGDHTDGNMLSYEPTDGGPELLMVWIPHYFDYSAMVHEIGHLVMYIFARRRITYGFDNEEQFTYYSEFWAREFIKVMVKREEKEQGKKVRRKY